MNDNASTNKDKLLANNNLVPEWNDLKGFSRSIAELEWLILILVLLYVVAPGSIVTDQWGILLASIFFAAFIIIFHYLNLFEKETNLKLAIETWAMIAFVSWVLWHTGKINSPLLNLYILIIITSGLTLGKLITFLVLLSITIVYLYMGLPNFSGAAFSMENFTFMMTLFSPYLLVAYLTSTLSADLHLSRKMYRELSETDELTGLGNNRAFTKILVKEIKKSARYKHNFSVLMLDTDNLGKVNNQYGHTAGDLLIKTVGNSIAKCLRETDTVSRYGGNQFVVLLPETNSNMAKEASDRIKTAVENTTFDLWGNQIKLSISIGITTFPEDGDNLQAILHSADKALIKIKLNKKNVDN